MGASQAAMGRPATAAGGPALDTSLGLSGVAEPLRPHSALSGLPQRARRGRQGSDIPPLPGDELETVSQWRVVKEVRLVS